VFHLVAEEINHEFAPGLKANCWGYNGHVNSTVIEAVAGERVRIYVTNKLPAPTTVHWHGVFLPNGMDGVGGLNQPLIGVGETFIYEFTLRQHGTFMFHSHHDEMTQMAMGLIGLFVIHPRNPQRRVEQDFALMLSEWKIDVGTSRPDPSEMNDFNILTFNGKCFPGTAPLICQLGERIRIRLGNLSVMDHHPIHLHGFYFRITATDGGAIPVSAQWPETSVLVAAGQTRDIEFIADAPGDWAMHCHMIHHLMNQMGHGIPNMVGVDTSGLEAQVDKLAPQAMLMGMDGMSSMAEMTMDGPENSIATTLGQGPFGPIMMGGMFTIVKVRAKTNGQQDPGWYRSPPGTRTRRASNAELARDGIVRR
jgi:FtsP/CotA-like multicopper oxidase with cupredoxin domain